MTLDIELQQLWIKDKSKDKEVFWSKIEEIYPMLKMIDKLHYNPETNKLTIKNTNRWQMY